MVVLERGIQHQLNPQVAGKDRLLAPTEAILPILSPDMAIMVIIAEQSALMTARSSANFPETVIQQTPYRLRLKNPKINNPLSEVGSNRLKGYEYHRGSRSRGPCNACETGQEEGHHGGRRCRKRGKLRSNLKLQQNPIRININILPSKTSVL